jgi:hypothetical protein
MTSVKVGLEYDRPVPEAWERAVWAVAPPSNFLSWLKIVWEPGDAWEPIERWMIYQMRPRRLIRPEVLAELQGPSPRSTGHYCAPGYCMCAMKRNGWRGGAAKLIDYMQWKLFQQTGCLGSRWWCIQGDQGGHRHRLDKIEAKVSRLHNGPSDTPAPGDLPYADFDLRTFRKIAELDRVRMWKGVTDYVDRNHATMNAEERDEGERAQWAMWSWLESQVKQTVDKIGKSGANALRDAAPRHLGKPVAPTDEEAIQQDFILNHDNT